MTAPRHSARSAPRPARPVRPSSATIFLASLCVALALPIGAMALAFELEGAAALASVAGMVFVVLSTFLWATKRRAGRSAGRGGLLLPAIVSAGLISAAYVGIALAWDETLGPDNDFVGLDILFPLGAMAAVTLVVVYSTLSMART